MKQLILKPIVVAFTLFAATTSHAADTAKTVMTQLTGTWFVEVTGVLPDGGTYQNLMNVDADGTADIVGGYMFGAGGMKFTDSPASITKADEDGFEIRMFAFLADTATGAPKGMNITVYRGALANGGEVFQPKLIYITCPVR